MDKKLLYGLIKDEHCAQYIMDMIGCELDLAIMLALVDMFYRDSTPYDMDVLSDYVKKKQIEYREEIFNVET